MQRLNSRVKECEFQSGLATFSQCDLGQINELFCAYFLENEDDNKNHLTGFL